MLHQQLEAVKQQFYYLYNFSKKGTSFNVFTVVISFTKTPFSSEANQSI